jgi:hypothetical protein
MMTREKKKEIETYVLSAARKAGLPIPPNEISGEEPDFRFNSHGLGVEVSEIMRPASSNHGIVPVEQEALHQEIMAMAEREYYQDGNVRPAQASVYFTNTRGKKSDKKENGASSHRVCETTR